MEKRILWSMGNQVGNARKSKGKGKEAKVLGDGELRVETWG